MPESIKPWLLWLHTHPHLAIFAIFLISLAESIAVLGLLIPGSVVMTAVGILVGSGVFSFTTVTLVASAGAVTGDIFSFWLGYHYHEKVRVMWPFRRYPQMLQKGEIFFQKHGGKGIFLGRFIGPIRPILPLIAGMMSMRPIRFILFDIFSGLLWAPAYMLPGILVGAASQELAPEASARLLLYVLLILLGLWCASWLLKLMYTSLVTSLDRLLARTWNIIQRHPRLTHIEAFLRDPSRPHSHGQLGLTLLTFLLAMAFIALTYSVWHHGVLTDGNEIIYHFMRSLRATFADQRVVLITFIGQAPVMIALWLGVFAWLVIKRYWRAAMHWLAIGMFSGAGVEMIKHLIHNPRPPGLLVTPAGWSFPSGHSTLSTTFFGFLAVLLSHHRTKGWRWLAAIAAGALSAAIIFSRLYLGAHWLSDVVGGLLLGLTAIGLFTVSYRRKPAPAMAPVGVLGVAVLSLALGWYGYFQKNYLTALQDYTPYWPNYSFNAEQWWAQGGGTQIPVYRENRFGKPIQMINVQWLGRLIRVENALQQKGWHKVARPSLAVFMSGLLSKNASQQMPMLSQLYEDRRPVLMMTKYLAGQHALIVLRLWDAHLQAHTGTPLWVGTVAYHQPWGSRFLRHNNHTAVTGTDLIPATRILTQDLPKQSWKQKFYPSGKHSIVFIRI